MREFLHLKESVVNYFIKKGVTDSTISEYCATAMVPIIVVCQFLIEEFPEHEKMCQEKSDRVKKFMGVK